MNKRIRKKKLREIIVAILCNQLEYKIGEVSEDECGGLSIRGIAVPKKRKDFDSCYKHTKYQDICKSVIESEAANDKH